MGTAPQPASGRRVSYAEAAEILAGRDPVLAELVAKAGPMKLTQ